MHLHLDCMGQALSSQKTPRSGREVFPGRSRVGVGLTEEELSKWEDRAWLEEEPAGCRAGR